MDLTLDDAERAARVLARAHTLPSVGDSRVFRSFDETRAREFYLGNRGYVDYLGALRWR